MVSTIKKERKNQLTILQIKRIVFTKWKVIDVPTKTFAKIF